MSEHNDRLGGRLPLADPADFGAAQRELFEKMTTTVVPWADEAGFRSTTDDGRFIGPFNPGLELRRLHWLTSLSRNFNLLMELRGGQPPGTAMEIELSELGAATWTKGDQAYEDVRAKKRSSEEVRRYLRQLQDEYRAAYTSKAGITLEQMDRFFAPGVELP